MINNVDAVFNNPFVFRRPLQRRRRFFKAQGRHRARPGAGLAMRRTNFIPDIMNAIS